MISGSARLQLLRAKSANGRYEVVDELSGDPMSLTNVYTEDEYLNGGSFFYKARYLARRSFPFRGVRKISYESSDILDVEPGPLAIVNRFDVTAPNPTRVVTGSDDLSFDLIFKKPTRWPNEC